VKPDRKFPLEFKHRWMGALGCLVFLALFLFFAIAVGWWTESGIFAPLMHPENGPSPQERSALPKSSP
jgi:hypothetical protein